MSFRGVCQLLFLTIVESPIRPNSRFPPGVSLTKVVRNYRNYCIDQSLHVWHSFDVPTSSDAKIKLLFGRAMTAKDEAELKRVAKELRAAITEHARIAKRPLLHETPMFAAGETSGD